jgi:hypothetical protein
MNATELNTNEYYIGTFGDKRLLEKGILLFKIKKAQCPGRRG